MTAHLSERLDDLATKSELNSIDNHWRLERESLIIHDKHGNSQIPTRRSSIAAGINITLFGCFWTAMAISASSAGASFGIAKVFFPAFAIIFIALGTYKSRSNFNKAVKYERAERRYRQQRSEAEQSRTASPISAPS